MDSGSGRCCFGSATFRGSVLCVEGHGSCEIAEGAERKLLCIARLSAGPELKAHKEKIESGCERLGCSLYVVPDDWDTDRMLRHSIRFVRSVYMSGSSQLS